MKQMEELIQINGMLEFDKLKVSKSIFVINVYLVQSRGGLAISSSSRRPGWFVIKEKVSD